MRFGIRLVGLVMLMCACSRGSANRDSSAADSVSPALSGATTAPTATTAPATDSTKAASANVSGSSKASSSNDGKAATGTGQRPSPLETRPTPPKNPVNPPKLPPGSSAAGAGDTARGTPAVVGTSFQSNVVLQRPGGGSIKIAGPHAKTIGALSGADVWVEGTRDAAGALEVSRFAVRSVDGVPAIDGVLRTEGNAVAVVTPDGARHTVASAPDALKQHVGSRVWVTGAASGPVVFGVISKNPE